MGVPLAEAVLHAPLIRSARRALQVSPAVAYGVRFAVVVSAAIWIGKVSGLVENNSQWILITVLMVMQPMSGGSLMKGLLRAVGTAAAAFTAILLFGLAAQVPPLLIAGLFGVQAVAGYGNAGRRYQYAWFVWAFTTAIVLGDAMAGQGEVETQAFQRASMVGIGILLVFVVDSLLWPTRSEPRLLSGLAERARQLGEVLKRAIVEPFDPNADGAATVDSTPGALGGQLALLDAARSELGVSRSRADALGQLALLLEALASRARVFADSATNVSDAGTPDPAYAAAMTDLALEVERALQDVAESLASARPPDPFMERVDRGMLAVESERDRLGERVGWSAALEAHAADLSDLAALLRAVEDALSSLASEEDGRGSSSPKLAPSFQIDPFRVKVGIRTGIAVCAAFLVPLVLGWNVNTMVAPMAFIAAAFTRGGAARGLIGLAGIVLFGWLLADLALVYFTPYVGRMPLVLAYSFVVAGVFAYVRVLRPQLAALPSIGGLLAILPVYGGLGAQTDVYGTYNTVCYIALGLGIGWIASRVFWPSTAAGLFRDRIAVQLELCLDSFRRAGSPGRAERAREALRDYEEQLVQLGSLHAEADQEPVEQGLDASRRAALLALTRDLFDAVGGTRRVASAAVEPLWQSAGAAFLPLREALEREEEALVAGMQANVAALRGAREGSRSRLAEAHQAVLDRLAELRESGAHMLDVGADTRRELLVRLDSHRRAVTRQLAMQAWLADWRSQASSAS